MDPLLLDGNAVAGLLQEAFAVEMTTALETCDGCGRSEPVGAVHVYRSAGIVLRCPHCGTVLATIVRGRSQTCISMSGTRALELSGEPRPPSAARARPPASPRPDGRTRPPRG